ncbi:MAG TPA: nitrogenase component 1 [Bacteroidales bacterium]|nr:nitrogenase component 1 [Bacteroidales bacterium]
METTAKRETTHTSTRNACKLCAPLGASLVFKGIKGCIPMLHGSQGCATYIRRYMISHYKEPVDIASSNFSEESTIYGGNKNFCQGIDNVIKQYNPEVIGIASTCLSETIGEDIPRLIKEYRNLNSESKLPVFIHASTPSYQGSHMDGFHETVLATISILAEGSGAGNQINIFPGFVSPADIRHLKELFNAFGLKYMLFPDYSDTLDNPHWKDYQLIPEGGTPIDEIRQSGAGLASVEFGTIMNKVVSAASNNTNGKPNTAGEWLEKKFHVPLTRMNMPIGIDATDKFVNLLEDISEKEIPEEIKRERGRLIDAYVDGHKYAFGKRAIVYGEEDLVLSMVAFLEEIGIDTVLAGSGGESSTLKREIDKISNGRLSNTKVLNDLDFETINELADELKPDIFIGNSKGYYIARRLGKPLVRIGFPIHDRFGAQRLQHIGYRGTQQLFDRIINALIEYKQEHSPVGYKYI